MRLGFAVTSLALMTVTLSAANPLAAAPEARDIMLSAEDGKPVRPGDDPGVSVPDQLRVLQVTASGTRTIGSVAVPASMVGPPESVKMTADGRWAVVSASQKLERLPGMPPRLVPDDSVSLIDLRRPAQPRVASVVHAGAGASGVAFSRDGECVLVANAGGDSISLFRRRRDTLEPGGTLILPRGSKPVAARFLADGTAALVVGGSGRLFRISIVKGALVPDPYSTILGTTASAVVIGPDGQTAYVLAASRAAAIGGGPAEPFVAAIDTASLRTTARVSLPSSAEGLALSPTGRFLEVTLLNGTNLAVDAPGHNDHGVLGVISTRGTDLSIVARTNSGRLCQGAAWSKDERQIFLQCAEDRRIESYTFNGRDELRRGPFALDVPGRPGALTTASSL